MAGLPSILVFVTFVPLLVQPQCCSSRECELRAAGGAERDPNDRSHDLGAGVAFRADTASRAPARAQLKESSLNPTKLVMQWGHSLGACL